MRTRTWVVMLLMALMPITGVRSAEESVVSVAGSPDVTFSEATSRAYTVFNDFAPLQVFTDRTSRAHTVVHRVNPPIDTREALSRSHTIFRRIDDLLRFAEAISRAVTAASCGTGGLPDTDGDGVPDDCDRCPGCDDHNDRDGDGIPDGCPGIVCDNCPDIYNPGQEDCDHNGIGDVCEIAAGAADCTRNGIPDACEPDCNGNGKPDSCDIAGLTPECPPGTPACADCNLNGVPDGCDIASGRSLDVKLPLGVPDECVTAAAGINWSDNIWGLAGNNPYPDNVQGVPDLHVTLPDSVNLLLDVTVQVDSLRMQNGSILRVTQPGAGDLSIKSPGNLAVGGELRVANDRAIIVPGGLPESPAITIGSGGVYHKDPEATSSTSAALNAAGIVLDSPDSDPANGPKAQMILTDQMHVQSERDFVIQSNPNAFYVCGGAATANVAGGITPPILKVRNQATLDIGGSFVLSNAASLDITSAMPMHLEGDFVNASVYPQCFDCLQATWVMNGTTPQTFEAAGENRGASLTGFDANFAIGTFELAENAVVRVVDAVDNEQDGVIGCEDVLFVRNLVLRPGSRLETADGCRVYFDEIQNDGGRIPGLGHYVLSITVGDADVDGDVDLADFAVLSNECLSGPSSLTGFAAPTADCLATFDVDRDDDIDAADFPSFQHSLILQR